MAEDGRITHTPKKALTIRRIVAIPAVTQVRYLSNVGVFTQYERLCDLQSFAMVIEGRVAYATPYGNLGPADGVKNSSSKCERSSVYICGIEMNGTRKTGI